MLKLLVPMEEVMVLFYWIMSNVVAVRTISWTVCIVGWEYTTVLPPKLLV